MVIEELNEVTRQMYAELIDRGFKKFPMAEVTLGKSFSPQFNKFIEGDDLGLNPLTRMFNGLGGKLHIVPAKEGDSEFEKIIEKQYRSFLETSKNDLIDHIENRPDPKRNNINNTNNKVYSNIVDELLDDLD